MVWQCSVVVFGDESHGEVEGTEEIKLLEKSPTQNGCETVGITRELQVKKRVLNLQGMGPV